MSTSNGNERGKKQQWPKIREIQHKNGTKAWLVDGRLQGKGERFFFKTKGEAETKAQQLRIARKNSGESAFSISDELRVEALKCAERLKPFGKSLSDAVDFFLPHLERISAGKIVRDVAAEILGEKAAEVKAATLKPYRTRINGFVARFGERNLATIATEEIKAWLDSNFADAVTRANTRRVIVNFFNIAKTKKYVTENPAAETRVKKVTAREIGILSPEQVAALLENADAAILPYFAIGAFAGVRPEELLRLEWADFKWKQGVIRIRAEVSKVSMARNVKIEPNLSAWLESYRFAKGRVCPSGWRDLFRETRMKAGIAAWPHDCLRHSFATYWLESYKDTPLLALEMGNSAAVILKHYGKVLDEPEDAATYWNIFPATVAKKVVAMTA